MARLEGKVCIVTGAASGIGAASARRFAEEGAAVVGFDLGEPVGDDWNAAAAAAPDHLLVRGDVRDEEAIADVARRTLERFGQIDVLMNAAGVAGGGPVHLLEAEAWDQCMDVNLKGTFLACKAVLPNMLERCTGSIINVASIEGVEGFEGGSVYNASKGGVVLLTKNMAMDYGRKGVRVNAICPGFIETPLLDSVFGMEGLAHVMESVKGAHQLGRFGRPVEIANGALFLASDEASFVSGHSLVIDGGFTAGHRFGLSELMGLG
jgi:NAD(P)-dependent dehydrogenase (short-subunit alcohol dehydrogenase family)